MRILLDECVPWPMHRLLAGHDCTTVQQCGWGGIKNGDLLRLAEGEFDMFVTSDQNILHCFAHAFATACWNWRRTALASLFWKFERCTIRT